MLRLGKLHKPGTFVQFYRVPNRNVASLPENMRRLWPNTARCLHGYCFLLQSDNTTLHKSISFHTYAPEMSCNMWLLRLDQVRRSCYRLRTKSLSMHRRKRRGFNEAQMPQNMWILQCLRGSCNELLRKLKTLQY